MATIYRGYDVKPDGFLFKIEKDGELVVTEPVRFATESAAMDWIDKDKRKQSERKLKGL